MIRVISIGSVGGIKNNWFTKGCFMLRSYDFLGKGIRSAIEVSEKYLPNIFEIVLWSCRTSCPLLNTTTFCLSITSFNIFHGFLVSLKWS